MRMLRRTLSTIVPQIVAARARAELLSQKIAAILPCRTALSRGRFK